MTKPSVHILANWPGKFPAQDKVKLTEQTIRVGFPTSELNIHTRSDLNHYQWIAWLIENSRTPFIILDVDIVFHSSCEWFPYKERTIMAGRYTPSYHSPFTRCHDQQRLHTSFLYINPAMFRTEMFRVNSNYPHTEFLPIVDYIKPFLIPSILTPGKFYDTLAVAYNAFGGDIFNEKQLDCYDHMQSGTLVHLVAPHLKDIDLKAAHALILENPSLIKGQWRVQDEWYKNHAII